MAKRSPPFWSLGWEGMPWWVERGRNACFISFVLVLSQRQFLLSTWAPKRLVAAATAAEATTILTGAQGACSHRRYSAVAGTTQPEEQGGRPLGARSTGDKKEVEKKIPCSLVGCSRLTPELDMCGKALSIESWCGPLPRSKTGPRGVQVWDGSK